MKLEAAPNPGKYEFPGDEIEVGETGYSLGDYREAIRGEGPLSYQWSDKPHRLVYDLINEIKRLRKTGDAESHITPEGNA